jgi:hypothetical protein
MDNQSSTNLRSLAPGVILALLSILFGFFLGGAFGAAEDAMKNRLRVSADNVLDTVYGGDEQKRDAVVSKSWSYLKRAHLHGGGIGATALAAIVLLALLGPPGRLERISSAAFGAGALLYSIFWLAAGFTAPALGSTGAAKEALGFLALPGAGLSLLGLLGTLIAALRRFASPAGN